MNYKVVGQYIKKIEFSIPNPKVFFLLTKNIANYKITIDIKSNRVKERIIEVQTTLNLIPSNDTFEKIDTKIIYSAIIELSEDLKDKEEIEKIVLVNVPTKIYSEIRKIFVLIFESSGFKDIQISKEVDFQKLYDQKKIQ